MAGEFELPSKLGLFEVTGEVVIGDEAIDRNGHVNNAYYQTIYEEQRGLYVTTCVMPLEEMEESLKAHPFMVDFGGRFRKQVFSGNHITVHTAAQDELRYIKFLQYMAREGSITGHFWCTIYMIGENGRARLRVPDEIRDKINQVNQRIYIDK